MMNVEQMISDARSVLGVPYVSPGTNDQRGIDCSGLFVMMFKRQGEKIAHGSNTIWRQYTTSNKGIITKTVTLKIGMAVFKWSKVTPSKFGDTLGDFHHIGIVASTNPLQIIHASSAKGKVVIDTSLDAWDYYAELKKVDYSTKKEVAAMVTICAENGGAVNVRERASKLSGIVCKIPSGSKATVVENGDKWTKIGYNGYIGYVMNEFICGDVQTGFVTRKEFNEAFEKLMSEIEKIGGG